MKLEEQVVSLDLAKRLKELGVPQESYFAWAEQCVGTNPKTDENIWDYRIMRNDFQARLEYLSAFTVAELGEMLPWDMIAWRNIYKEWVVQFQANGLLEQQVKSFGPDTEANVRAQMLIHLLENKLITLK